MKKVITTMLVAAMVLSMAMPTSAATITRKKSTGTTASTTKVSGDYSLKMVDKTLQFIRGGKVVSSIETKDGKITLRKSSAGGVSVVFTDANGKRRNITLGKQKTVALSGTFVQVSVDKALGSSYEVEMEKGSKVTNFYAKGAAKVTLNGSVTTLNVTSSNANVAANGTVTRAYAVNKKAITGMSSGKITQTTTGTANNGSVTTTGNGSSNTSNTTVNSGSGSGSSSSSSGSGIIINGGGSNNGGNTTSKRNPKLTASSTAIPTYDEGTVLNTIPLAQFGLKAMYGNTEVAGKFAFNNPTSTVAKGERTYIIVFTPTDSKTYNSATINVKIMGKEVVKTQTLAEAKKAIEDRLATLSVDNKVTEATIKELADNEIKAGSGITATVADYVKTPATTTAPGSVTATITLTKGNETETIKVNLPIAQLSAIDEAKAAVEAVLDELKAGKDTDKAAVEAALAEVIAKYKDINISVGDVALDETAKTVSVKVTLTEGDGEPVEVSKTWTYTDPAENKDLADAVKAVEDLKGPYADDTAAKKAIEDAVKAINQDIAVDTSKVVLSEDGATVAGEVELSLNGETAKANFEASIEQGEADKAVAPEFIKKLPEEPMNITIDAENPTVLEVEATVTDGGQVSYQWYKNTENFADISESKKISGATGATYTPTETGNYYIYVVATNTLGGDTTNTASTPSKVLRVSVSYPEGSAEEPTVTLNTSSDVRVEMGDTSPVLSVSASLKVDPAEGLSYQWYKTNSAVAQGGEAIEGATSATYSVPTNTVGKAYYYCVVTNTNNEASEVKVVSKATPKAVAVTVTNTVTMHATPVASDATTKTINLHFTAKIENLDTATAADYTVVGKDHAADESCTIKVVEAKTNINQQDVTLTISGVDKSEDALVKFNKQFEGVTISYNTAEGAEVAIKKEADAGKVAGIDTIAAVDGANATDDTTQIEITFTEDKAIENNSKVVFTDSANNTITSTKVEQKNPKTWIATIALVAGTPNNSDLTLTRAGDITLESGKELTVTVFRDTTPPELTKAMVDRKNPSEVVLWFNDEVELSASTPLTLFSIGDAKSTGIAKISGEPKKLKVTFKDPIASGATEITYTEDTTARAGNSIVDVSVAKNKLATGSKESITFTSNTTVEIEKVETIKASNDATKIEKAILNMSVAVTTANADTDNKGLATGFTVTDSLGGTHKPATAKILPNIQRTTATGSYIELTFAQGDEIPAGATIVSVVYDPSKATIKMVDYFDTTKEVAKVEAEVTTDTPLASDLKILSAVPAGLPTAEDKADIPGRGHKNFGKYSVSMKGNEITVTVNDQLVAYDDIWVNKVDANGSQAFTPILVQVNKTYGTEKSEQKTEETPTDTAYLTITNKATGKFGNWDSADILDVANYDTEAAARKDTFVLWVQGDKGGTTNYSIKTAEGETAIDFSVKVVPFTGDSAIGLAQLKATPEKVFTAAEEPASKADPKLEGFKVTVDSASIPKTATEVWYVAAQEGNSSIEYGDNISQVAPDNSDASKTATGTKVKITPKAGAYVTETISEFASIDNNARSTPTWGDSTKYCGFVHIYAADKNGKIVGYVVVNVPKDYIPAKEAAASDAPVVASINVDEKTDKNDDITIGASDEKKD